MPGAPGLDFQTWETTKAGWPWNPWHNSCMSDPLNKFSRRSNENLLQLWRARDKVSDFDIDPLRDELDNRGLSKEMEEISQQASVGSIYSNLPPGPQTYLNLSVPFWWLRELRLRSKTNGGRPVEATVTKAQRTRSGMLGTARAELLYSYEFQGQQYTGRVVRDFQSGADAADALALDHHTGEKLSILINQENPEISYYPSGLGSIDPILTGFQSLFSWAVVAALARQVLFSILPIR